MIADIKVTEKSFGAKSLMNNINITIDDGEKIGVIGRNGVGKSTLFGILNNSDTDYTGEIRYKPGAVVVATQQEHHDVGDATVLQYVLQGLPEYSSLSHVIETYPDIMGEDLGKIKRYSEALERFNDKGFYQIEEEIELELRNFQLPDLAHKKFSTLSGGQKRLVEVVKIMHSDANLVLVDEPTNHMDYVAKEQFIKWLKQAREAVLVITHDRDVLRSVDKIVEIKDGSSQSYKGNYDAYLKQNAISTGSKMNEFEMVEKRITNLKSNVIRYQRLKEKSRNPSTIKNFKRLEMNSRKELAELQARSKPTFWIDRESVGDLKHKTAGQYEKFKAKNVKLNMKSDTSSAKHTLVSVRGLSLGYDTPLFADINFDLSEGSVIELRGRNASGKTTLIKAILGDESVAKYAGSIDVDKHARIGIYEQEVAPTYFDMTLEDAIEKMYLSRDLQISTTKIRSLMNDYLFEENDRKIPIKLLSGGQKARFQLIAMLANDPQLLILDEPTNHLDLPSIEELESAIAKYSGAIIYVSHDGYFRAKFDADVIKIGKQ